MNFKISFLLTSIAGFSTMLGCLILLINTKHHNKIITFGLSVIGTKIGNKFGIKYKNKAEVAGGIILILLGVKILLEHLSIINF